MKTLLKYLYCTVIFFSIPVISQNSLKYSGLFSGKCTNYGGNNLKDSVKSVFCVYTKIKETLTQEEKRRVQGYNEIRPHHKYMEFNKYAQRTLDINCGNGGFDVLLNFECADKYIFDDKDWAEKSKYKTALKQYYPVSNNNLLLKLNCIEVPQKDDVFEEDGKIWQDYNERIYIYIYDNLGRVMEEREYYVDRFGKATLNKKYREEDLFTRKLFTYNDNGQVVNQKIIPGLYGKDMPYTDMGSECGFCDDLQLKYAYDPLGRITQVIMYGCGKIVVQEDYSYHPTKDYVEKVRFYNADSGGFSNDTKKSVKNYNEQGDIISNDYIPDYPDQRIKEKAGYYTYEYDSHNNWIKCNMYLEGTKEGEPSLVAERKIEYYN